QAINASDMQVRPDPTTARMDPIARVPTLSFICNVFDPITGQPYSRDPRFLAQKAVNHLRETGIADTVYVGPEAELFVFDDIRYELTPYSSFFAVDSQEGAWNSGRDEGPNLGYKPGYKGGYFPCPPHDSLYDLRTDMAMTLESVGITVDVHHHEAATAGQSEIGIKYNELIKSADDLQWFKYIIKNIARRHNKTATFMPKPLHGDSGSGMHTHFS